MKNYHLSFRLLLLLLFISFSFAYCQKPDITYPAFDPNDLSQFSLESIREIADLGKSATDINFSPEGNHLFLTQGGNQIRHYFLKKAFDVSSLHKETEYELFNTPFSSKTLRGLYFAKGGMRLFLLIDRELYQYDLKEPYDLSKLSTLEYTGKLMLEKYDPYSFSFTNDGEWLYINYRSSFTRYTLSTPFDIISVSGSISHDYDSPSRLRSTKSFKLIRDGNLMMGLKSGSHSIFFRMLDEKNDLKTVVSTGTEFLVPNLNYWTTNFAVHPDERRFYIISGGSEIHTYRQSYHQDYFTNSAKVPVIDIDADDGKEGETDHNITYSLTGQDASHFTISAAGLINFVDQPVFSTPADFDKNNKYELSVIISNSKRTNLLPLTIDVRESVDHPEFVLDDMYDFKNITYKGKDYDLEVLETPSSMQLSRDGMHLFVTDLDRLLEYQLKYPYDLRGAIFKGESNPNLESEVFNISKGGTRLYTTKEIKNSSRSIIQEWILSKPYSTSSASLNAELTIDLDYYTIYDIQFNVEGTKIFLLTYNYLGKSELRQLNLSSPFDVSTAQNAGTYNISSYTDRPKKILLAPNGKKIFIKNSPVYRSFRNEMAIVNLNEAFDITTAFYGGQTEAIDYDWELLSPVLSPDYSRLFLLGDAGILTFTVGGSVTYQENSTEKVFDANVRLGANGESDSGVDYSLRGEDAAQFSIDIDGVVRFVEIPDYEKPLDVGKNNTYEILVVASEKGNPLNEATKELEIHVEDLEDKWIATDSLSYINPTLTVTNESHIDISFGGYLSSAFALQYADSGKRLFVLGYIGNSSQQNGSYKMIEFRLRKPYDLTEKTYVGRHTIHKSGVRDFAFNADGSRIFFQTLNELSAYELEEPFDLETISNEKKTLTFTENSSTLNRGFEFDADGKRLYITNTSEDILAFYDLSEPYDLSQATYSGDVLADLDFEIYTFFEDFVFSPNGYQLVALTGGKRVLTLDLEVAFNPSTAFNVVYTGLDSLNNDDNHFNDITLKPDGSSALILGEKDSYLLTFSDYISVDEQTNTNSSFYDFNVYVNDSQKTDQGVVYEIIGIDASSFEINSKGEVTFHSIPDFEKPADSNRDNVYEISIIGSAPEGIVERKLFIEVENIPDLPYFTNEKNSSELLIADSAGMIHTSPSTKILSFGANGSKLYVKRWTGWSGRTEEYHLKIPYDTSNAKLVWYRKFNFDYSYESLLDLTFDSTGLKVFVSSGRAIYEYSLSESFNLRTSSVEYIRHDIQSNSMEFSPDGSMMYLATYEGIVQYSLANAYDPATALIDDSVKKLVTPWVGSFTFGSSGHRLFATNTSSGIVDQFQLRTPYDVSTAVLKTDYPSFIVVNGIEESDELNFDGDGFNLFLGGRKYGLPWAVFFKEGSESVVIDFNANDGVGGADDSSVTYSLAGEDAHLFNLNDQGELRFIAIPDYMDPKDSNLDNFYSIEIAAGAGVANQTVHRVMIAVEDVNIPGPPRDLTDLPVITKGGQGFNVSFALHTGRDQDFNTIPYEENPREIIFNDSGSKMYLLRRKYSHDILEFNLRTPFDISTAIYAGIEEKLDLRDQSGPHSMSFSQDGKKLFVAGSNAIHLYNLMSPYDISSGVRDKSGDSYISDLTDFVFSKDGSSLISSSNSTTTSYILTDAFDLTTSQKDFHYSDMHFRVSQVSAMAVHPDGTKLYIVGKSGHFHKIYVYKLLNPFDLSSIEFAGYEQEIIVGDIVSEITGLNFNNDGTRMFATDQYRHTVWEYILPWSVDYEENSTDIVIDIDAEDGLGGSTDSSVRYILAGTDSSAFSINNAGQLVFINSPDFENPKDTNGDNTYEVSIRINNAEIPTKYRTRNLFVTVQNNDDSPVFTSVGSGFDLSTAEYAGYSETLFLGNVNFNPQLIHFSADGYKMIAYGYGVNRYRLVTYTLRNPFDVSSTVSFKEHRNFDTAYLTDIKLNQDGTKAFLYYANQQTIREYSLTEEFDLSTANHNGSAEDLNHSTVTSQNASMYFRKDGFELFLLTEDSVYSLDLPTPYDISEAVYTGEKMAVQQGTTYRNMEFNADGTILYIKHYTKVISYHLQMPFDLRSTSFTNQSEDFEVDKNYLKDTNYITFNKDGTRAFFTGDLDDRVIEYHLASMINYPENGKVAVLDADANDGRGGKDDESVFYDLTGPDGWLFTVDDTGVVTFRDTPNFEMPLDSGMNNVYNVTITATGKTDAFGPARQRLQIRVEDKSDDPVFTHSGYGYDLRTMVYTGNDERLILPSRSGRPTSNAFNCDGSAMFVLDYWDEKIYIFDLEDNYDVSTATKRPVDGDVDLSSITTSAIALTFSYDGSSLFILETGGVLYKIRLEQPYGLYGLGSLETVNLPGGNLSFEAITFSPDGTTLLTGGSDKMIGFNLTTPFDIQSISEANFTKNVISSERSIKDLKFNHDGTVLFVLGETTNSIIKYSLSRPYDLSSAVVVNHKTSIRFQTDAPSAMAFNHNGTKIFLTDQGRRFIAEYDMVAIENFDENEESMIIDIDANDGSGGNNDSSVRYSVRGKDGHNFSIDESGALYFNQPPDYENPLDSDSSNIYIIEVVAENEFDEIVQPMEVLLQNMDDDSPLIVSAMEIVVRENTTGTIYQCRANETVSLTVEDGNDGSLFEIDGTQLSFKTAPDYENPKDLGEDNCYHLNLKATDQIGNFTRFELGVQVVNVFEEGEDFGEPDDPELTSATEVAVAEESDQVFYQATSTIENTAFTLGQGKDGEYFQLSTNELSFIVPPDYENPQDADRDNIYLLDLILTAPDGNVNIQEIQVIVEDVDDKVTGLIDETSSFKVYPNPVNSSLSIESDVSFSEIKSILLYDLRGVVVKRFDPVEEMRYDLSDVREGIYILSISGRPVGLDNAKIRIHIKR